MVPSFLGCIARPEESAEAIRKLSATTFVQQVEVPALAVMVPLLVRGLQLDTQIKRKACVIIQNMSKLVSNPLDARLFLPSLLPLLESVSIQVNIKQCV